MYSFIDDQKIDHYTNERQKHLIINTVYLRQNDYEHEIQTLNKELNLFLKQGITLKL